MTMLGATLWQVDHVREALLCSLVVLWPWARCRAVRGPPGWRRRGRGPDTLQIPSLEEGALVAAWCRETSLGREGMSDRSLLLPAKGMERGLNTYWCFLEGGGSLWPEAWNPTLWGLFLKILLDSIFEGPVEHSALTPGSQVCWEFRALQWKGSSCAAAAAAVSLLTPPPSPVLPGLHSGGTPQAPVPLGCDTEPYRKHFNVCLPSVSNWIKRQGRVFP